jgi:DNA-binding Xre family transcriptional regulator
MLRYERRGAMAKVANRFKELVAIKERRDDRRWTYREISAATGINPATLTRFANQRHEQMDLKTLAKLCEFLSCKVGELLILEDDDLGQRAGAATAIA